MESLNTIIKLQEMIMEIYDVRPSTAYQMMIIMSRIAEVANNEYTYGRQDASERGMGD